MAYAPERGDIILANLSPQAGHEMAGPHRCLVLSEARFSIATGYAVVCPITTKVKGSPFEVQLPTGMKANGCVVASEIRTIDYLTRAAKFLERASQQTTREVQAIVAAILGIAGS